MVRELQYFLVKDADLPRDSEYEQYFEKSKSNRHILKIGHCQNSRTRMAVELTCNMTDTTNFHPNPRSLSK